MGYGSNPSIDQVIQVLIQTGNSQNDVASLNGQVTALQAQLNTMATAGRAAGKSVEAIAADLAPTVAKLQEVNSLLDAYSRNSAGTIKNTQAMSRAFLEMSRGVEDFATGGPLGVLNNIPGTFYAIGQAIGLTPGKVAGLTSAVSLLGTAAFLAYQHWSDIKKAIGDFSVETAVAELDRLKQSTTRTVDETQRLVHLQQQAAAMKAQLEGKTPTQAARAKAVQTAVSEADDNLVVKGLVERHGGELVSTDKEAREAADEVAKRQDELKTTYTHISGGRKVGIRERTPEEYAEAIAKDAPLQESQQNLRTVLDAAARRLMGDAELSANRLKALRGMVQATPGAFPGGFGEDLDRASPDAIHNTLRKKARDKQQADADAAVVEGNEAEKQIADAKAKRQREQTKDSNEAIAAGTEAEQKIKDAKLKRQNKQQGEADKDVAEGVEAAQAQEVAEGRNMNAVQKKRHADAAKLMHGGLGDQVEKEILQNKLMLDVGDPNAMAPGMLANSLRNRVGFDLAQGGKDPTLANEIVEMSRSHLQDRVVHASGKTATTMDGVADVQSVMLQLLQETMNRLDHVEMQTHQNRNQARGLQNRKPSAQRTAS